VLRGLRLLALMLAASPAAWLPAGPYGGHIQTIAFDPHGPDLLYAATYRYPAEPLLFRSSDAGANWSLAGKFSYADVSCLTVDPFQRRTLLACSRGNVLWRSSDAGESWSSLTLPGHAASLAPDPQVNGRIYAAGYVEAAHPQPALLISADHGLTWSATVLDTADRGFQACRFGSGLLLAGGDDGLLLRSTDRGQSWEHIDSGLPASEPVLSLAICPADPAVLLCGTSGSLFRSGDSGRTWQAIPDLQKLWDIGFATDSPQVVYALCRDSVERVVVSSDTGRTWSGPASDSIFYRATDLLVDPRDCNTAWVNAYRGVLVTTDRGATWRYRNHGLDFADVYTIAVHPVNQSEYYVSAHDTRLFRTTDCGDSWTQTRGFWCMYNGMCCALAVAPEPGGDVVYGFEGSG
jgi:hypothetical protein